MADLYRKSSLERISSPEQLDKALTITSPMSWLALIGITAIIIVTVIWSILGTIPVTVSAPGLVVSPVGTNAVYFEESGTVVSIRAREGMEIGYGDAILTYKTTGSEAHTLLSDQVGYIYSLKVKVGDVANQGSEAVRISPTVTGKQVVVCYPELAKAKKLERGMLVQVYLDSVDSQTNGHMWARIINIDAHAATTDGMNSVLGTGNNLSTGYTSKGAVAAVTCELYPDESTASGYDWTNAKGGKLDVSNGSPITAKVIVEEIRPITKLFIKFKEIWGN